jgi:thiamine pyrophosphokinase
MNKISQNAFVFANGEPCSHTLLNTLLNQYPDAIKIVLDGGIEHFEQYNLVPDVWMGDFDHYLNEKEILDKYPNLTVIHTPDQEYTDLEKALIWLQKHDFKTVHVFWATGRRLDHTVNNTVNIARFSSVFEKIVLYDDYSMCMPLPNRFEQYFRKDTVISLVPLGTVTGIVTENLKYPLNHEELRLGYRNGTSNEVLQDGWVRITYQNGDLLLILENK